MVSENQGVETARFVYKLWNGEVDWDTMVYEEFENACKERGLTEGERQAGLQWFADRHLADMAMLV